MAKKKQAPKAEPPPRRERRGVDQMIADLEAKIAAIRAREAEKKAKADPALRHVKAALRSVDKALSAAKDAALRDGLGEARGALSSVLGAKGGDGGRGETRVRRTASEFSDLADALLNYVRSNPGQRGEQIAAALATDTKTMRPVMKRLIGDGKIATEGQRRDDLHGRVARSPLALPRRPEKQGAGERGALRRLWEPSGTQSVRAARSVRDSPSTPSFQFFWARED